MKEGEGRKIRRKRERKGNSGRNGWRRRKVNEEEGKSEREMAM